jgi:hypothetical protein
VKRDWDVIRDVLTEVEGLSSQDRGDFIYGRGRQDEVRAGHAFLLWEAGFIKAIDANSLSGPSLISPDLTWEGHELLDTIRSKPVWEKVKTTAKDKGIELTFEAVIALGKAALQSAIGSGT